MSTVQQSNRTKKNWFSPRTQWESRLHDILVAAKELRQLMVDSEIKLEEDTFEVYHELDEIIMSVNYINILSNNHQYLCDDDYGYEMASYLQHTED
jgi:hypothetical protein